MSCVQNDTSLTTGVDNVGTCYFCSPRGCEIQYIVAVTFIMCTVLCVHHTRFYVHEYYTVLSRLCGIHLFHSLVHVCT